MRTSGSAAVLAALLACGPDTPGATTTSTSALTTSGGSTAATTTGAIAPTTSPLDPECRPVVGDHGDCQTPLGWAFDGQECTARVGCDCAPDCDNFFPDPAACAQACAAAGRCDPGKIKAAGLADDPVQPGDHCDGLYTCPGDDEPLKSAYQQIFGMLSCEPGSFPCGPEVCAGQWSGSLDPDAWQKLCAASLLPAADSLYCAVFGP
jgi:hypothetical protein